ncbi:MAG: hypothetical protein OEY45_11405 [Gammaproteobacteria bacterium]|nr:hypothetical protein [Gammaproteobacteria bacterium]
MRLEPVVLPVELESTVTASTPDQLLCTSLLIATVVSIEPVEYSSSQSPPSCALPVRSSEAATSAPVSVARELTSNCPSEEPARLQP